MDSTFSTTFRVRGYELRDDGAVGHEVYLHWFEEAAIQASAAAGYGLPEYDSLGAVWIMRDLDIEFLGTARYGEEIVVTTWVSDFRRVRSHRDYDARRRADNALLARARAEWVFMDMSNMAPRRLPPEMLTRFEPRSQPALQPIAWPEVRGDEGTALWESSRRVQQYEIDQMHHVNNSVYLAWIEQQAMDAWSDWGRDPTQLSLERHYIQFRRAAQSGDTVLVQSASSRKGGKVAWQHRILRDDLVLIEAGSIGRTLEAFAP